LDWPAAGCLTHAGLITALWVLAFKFDIEVLPGKVWMVFAMSWLLWLVFLLVSPLQLLKTRVIAGLVGVLILAPTIPTLYTFIVWRIGGFAS
jgi:hypothetical protein